MEKEAKVSLLFSVNLPLQSWKKAGCQLLYPLLNEQKQISSDSSQMISDHGCQSTWCIQINPHFSAELRLLSTLPSDCSSYCSISPTQLKSRISLPMNTHTHTNTHSAAWHGMPAPRQLCALWKESGLIRAGPRTCRSCLIGPGLQDVLAGFISLLTSLSAQALTQSGKLCSAVYLPLHTSWFVSAVYQHAVPLYSYLVNWYDEGNARDLIMSC